MSKKIIGVLNVVIGHIHSFHADTNVSRAGHLFADEKDQNELTKALLGGWKSAQGIPPITELTEEQQKVAVSEREAEWERLKAATEERRIRIAVADDDNPREFILSPNDIRSAWERLYTKNGKVIPPKYENVACFRRLACLPLVNALREKLRDGDIEELPCEVMAFSSKLEQVQVTIGENTLKDRGQRKLGERELLTASKVMFEYGGSQSDFRHYFKDGMGQKLWEINVVNAKFPKLRLLDRMLNPQADDYIPFSPIKPGDLRNLRKENAGEDAYGSFFADVKNGTKAKAEPTMPKKDMEAIVTQSPVDVVKLIVDAVKKNDRNVLNAFVDFKVEVNEALKDLLPKIKAKAGVA